MGEVFAHDNDRIGLRNLGPLFDVMQVFFRFPSPFGHDRSAPTGQNQQKCCGKNVMFTRSLRIVSRSGFVLVSGVSENIFPVIFKCPVVETLRRLRIQLPLIEDSGSEATTVSMSRAFATSILGVSKNNSCKSSNSE
jgi:hypothetical protein